MKKFIVVVFAVERPERVLTATGFCVVFLSAPLLNGRNLLSGSLWYVAMDIGKMVYL